MPPAARSSRSSRSTSPTFIDYSGKYFLHYLDRTGELIWMSERDGWNHLYLYDAKTGQVKNQITRGAWVVRGVDRVDEASAADLVPRRRHPPGQDPYYIHYCRVNFDGTGLTVLTEGDGTHTIEFSPDRRFLIDTYSRVDLPPVTELRRGDDGKLVCELERADWSRLLKTGWKLPERFVAKGRDGKTDIYGVIFRPTNFDPAKKYPVIEDIYAGPHGFVRAQAVRGVLLAIRRWPNWASSSCRSTAWARRTARRRSTMSAGRTWPMPASPTASSGSARRPRSTRIWTWTRVGIYGGSAGGQNALRRLLTHGDFYKAAVADCGCHDNRMDKIWWNEQWMGWPVGPQYAANSNVTNAHRLQGQAAA